MEILLTNDDSHGMPFLGFLMEYLEKIASVQVLVPAQEQSWKSKSRCSEKRLQLSSVQYCGREIYTLSGSPADCANIGIYHLFRGKPDLVVSGLNVGRNASLSFILSSGTVGAALEANIAGLPAVAFSQDVEDALFSYYRLNKSLPADVTGRLKEQNRQLLPRVFDWLSAQPGFYSEPLTWSVNLPFLAGEGTQIRRCAPAHSMYLSLYDREGDEFVRSDFQVAQDLRPGRDVSLLAQGHVVVTAIDIRRIGEA